MSSSTVRRSSGSGALKASRSPVRGCVNAEPLGVQKRPRQPLHRAQLVRHAAMHAAVERVADDRMADAAEMHANLVRAPGRNRDAQQRQPGHVPRPGDAGHRRSRAPRAGRDLLAMHRIAADRNVDALALLHQSPHQRDVLLLDFAIVKLARQLLVRGVVLGDDHHAGRALVETMHDARPQLAADAAQVGDVVQQRVDERAAVVSRAGCTTIPAGLLTTTTSASW